MPRSKQSPTIHILFIGNSFTQCNNLPGLIAEMAAERQIAVKYELLSAGGASLRTHWNAGKAAAAIASGQYEYVVLQEQSTLPVKNATRMAENMRLFAGVIKQAGSRAVLYMTWARQNVAAVAASHCRRLPGDWQGTGAIVVPVGLVWQNWLAKHEQPALYDSDQSHPTLAGSYLAACVFVATLFGVKAAGFANDPAGLRAADREVLQRCAWSGRGRRQGGVGQL